MQASHNKLVFFGTLLISLGIAKNIIAQQPATDSLKQFSSGDTLQSSNNKQFIETKITYEAEDSIVTLPKISQARFYGKSKLNYGSMNITAEVIEMDYLKNVITAYGKKDSLGKNIGTPVFKDGEQTMEAEKIMYNLKTKKGKIYNAWTKQGEISVYGKAIKKDSNNVVYFENMKCVLCKDEDARTVFRAKKAKVIPNDKIVTGPMYLEIGGVPTPLGLPFGFFPNTKKQHNGILLPTFGNSPERGFNLRQGGYYLGFNDKTDMIIKADVYANGSWALSTTNNYNVLYKNNGAVYLSYSYYNIGDPDIPSQFKSQTSSEIRWSHFQDNKSNPSVRFGANVNYVNNQSYNRLNSINTGQFLQNSFQSNVNFTKTFKLSSLSINAFHNQSTIGYKPVEITFPSLTFNVNRFFPFKREKALRQNLFDKIGISYLLTVQNTYSGYDSTLFVGNITNNLKHGLKQTLPISTNFNLFKYITVTPAINISSVAYLNSVEKEFNKNYKTPSDAVISKTNNSLSGGFEGNFSTALNTKIYMDYLFKKGKLKQVRHLLIPTLSYNFRPDFGDESYGFWKKVQADSIGKQAMYSIFENGIYGGPAMGKQNAIGFNLNNSFDAKYIQKSDTGKIEKKIALLQNISLSTNYNFAADSFKMSNIGITARTVIFKNININASSTFDPYLYENKTGRRKNQYVFETTGKLAQFVNANFAVSTAISSNMVEAAKKLKQAPNLTNGGEKGAVTATSSVQPMSWNLYLSYNLALTATANNKINPVQILNFSADLAPTNFWKIGVTSGFDFVNNKLSYTTFNIYRDLKCWEVRIGWVPFGANKSYNFTMNLKLPMLSDFKIPRQRQWFDNIQ